LSDGDIERLRELVRQLERNRQGELRNELSRRPDGQREGPRDNSRGGPQDFGRREFRGGPDGFPRGPSGPGSRWDTRRSPRGPDFRPFPARLDDLDRKMDRILQELEEMRRELRRR
jgi:hypothetical protein